MGRRKGCCKDHLLHQLSWTKCIRCPNFTVNTGGIFPVSTMLLLCVGIWFSFASIKLCLCSYTTLRFMCDVVVLLYYNCIYNSTNDRIPSKDMFLDPLHLAVKNISYFLSFWFSKTVKACCFWTLSAHEWYYTKSAVPLGLRLYFVKHNTC